jgi:hypothetical protein
MAFGGPGGGGGAYAKGTNLNLSFPVPCNIAPAGQTQGSGYATNFGTNSIFVSSGPNIVSAECGNTSTVYKDGGPAGYRFSPAGFAGGKGGDSPYQVGSNGAGGGGAAGPHGTGQAGGNSTTLGPNTNSAYGGAADGFATAGGTEGNNSSGLNGTQWDATHGCGSGGGGGHAAKGGNGGRYGGGGGGAGTVSGANQGIGIGGDGLIIVTYVSLPPVIPRDARALIMM